MDIASSQNMAIVAITRKGAALGRRLKQQLAGSQLYLPEKFAAGPEPDEHPFSSPAKKVVGEIFGRYRYLVLVMAVGIAVRLIAAKLSDKHTDPGVVVVDDAGTFCVSLLSGHIGGANELGKRIASLIGAYPVVTTASEASGTIAVDMLGNEFGWQIEDGANVSAVSAALVNGETVVLYQDAGENDWWPKGKPLPENLRIVGSIADLRQPDFQAALIITDRILNEEQRALLPANIVIYRPRSLVVGIGCNRGTPCAEIEAAVSLVFAENGLSIKSIRNIATITGKSSEAGLIEFAGKYHLPIDYFDKETLGKTVFPSSPSAAALRHVGTPAVCETAALLSSGCDSLVAPKTSYRRSVTVAVARLAFNNERQTKGRLFLVGIGPGEPSHMTQKAREVIKRSDVVVGYQTYIGLIESLITHQEVIATGMGSEVERVQAAIGLARQGKRVSLISSGDTGIYGMAGLVGEVLSEQPGNDLDIEVIPGVPLLAASAALLGSPVSGDFATVSLSDYLLPWSEISRRIKSAAEADYVIIIYNPRSKKRRHQMTEAREIILQHRAPSTPVGIVTNAYRPAQTVAITDLEHMLDSEIGMDTIIIVGNSTTFTLGDWMVTPRGYGGKYDLGLQARSTGQ
ncbi:MAG TPA: precorrin-3B C(17)-methyltransferase [Dehalococcoidia bacterium]|nr:precorrin-3B C(17)-methyltransferase [Dehalococcoidia bacterium]